MPRVIFVKKARKDNPAVKKGESYFHWKFRFGGKYYSKTRPKASQLTQSEYLSQMYGYEEQLAEIEFDSIEGIKDMIGELADEIESFGEEQEGKRNNMPESLQDSESGELLERRADACREWAEELRTAADDLEEYESDPDLDEEENAEAATEHVAEAISEIQQVAADIE